MQLQSSLPPRWGSSQQSFSLILPQFKKKSFILEICQLNIFLLAYFQFAHSRYIQSIHTFICSKGIYLSKAFGVGLYTRYTPSPCLPFPNEILPKPAWGTAKPYTFNSWIQSRDRTYTLCFAFITSHVFIIIYNHNNSCLKNTASCKYKKCHTSLEKRHKQNIKYLASAVTQRITHPPWGRTHAFLWHPLNTNIGLNFQGEGSGGTYFSAPKC